MPKKILDEDFIKIPSRAGAGAEASRYQKMFSANPSVAQNSPYYQPNNLSMQHARHAASSMASNGSNNVYKRDRSSSNNATKRPPIPAA